MYFIIQIISNCFVDAELLSHQKKADKTSVGTIIRSMNDAYENNELNDTQTKTWEKIVKKSKNAKKLFSIAIIIHDFADSYEVCKNSKLLHSLYTRGRHSQISTFIATQKFNALATILRVNADTLYVFRLRNYQDVSTFLDEVSAIVDKKYYCRCIKKQQVLILGF